MTTVFKKGKVLAKRIKSFLDDDSTSAKITKVVLALIAVGAVLTVAAMAPNVFQVFGSRYRRVKRYQPEQFQRNFRHLKKSSLIEIKNGKISLSKKGERKLGEYLLDEIVIKPMEKWDKKWRIVIFDIPLVYNTARKALRFKLKELGFYQLQKSVWIYPYPCFEEIDFVAGFFGIEEYLEFITADKLEKQEEKIKNYFHLQ